MSINENEFLEKLDEINSWDEWAEFEENFFNDSILIKKSQDEIEESLNRKDRTVDGVSWHAISCNYRNLGLYSLYEKMSLLVFEKLEPEQAADNALHPEWYGKVCYRCEIWTKNYDPEVCPICSSELLPFPLNEDD